MSYFALGQTISQAVGPRIGTRLSAGLGFYTTYIIVGFCMIFTLVVTISVVKYEQGSGAPLKLNFNDMVAKEALVPAAACFLIAIGFTSINSFLLVYAVEHGIKETSASLYFTVSAVALLATRPIVGKLTDKYGFVKIGTAAILITSLSLVLIGFSNNVSMLLTAAVVNSFGYGAAQPALQSLCVKSVRPERRGSGSATYYIGFDAGTILGPMICGKVANTFGYTPVMWCAVAVPVVFGAVVVLMFRNRVRQIENDFLAQKSKG